MALPFVLGIPLQWRWPYLTIYAAWVAFALFLDRISTRGWPKRLTFWRDAKRKWPHERVAMLLFTAFIIWGLTAYFRFVAISPLLTWSVISVLQVAGYLEASVVASQRLRHL